ncbi:hypothetical protein PL11201_660116 [Planktothrix sp. PCC 11201]|nr:hypothetical protein PL11201_660116 [Planktothrix sp. PCC 11201]
MGFWLIFRVFIGFGAPDLGYGYKKGYLSLFTKTLTFAESIVKWWA